MTQSNRTAEPWQLIALWRVFRHLIAQAQEAEPPSAPACPADIDRQAKHLYDKAMELMDYKQYERGLAMLNTVVRDNQGSDARAHGAHGDGQAFPRSAQLQGGARAISCC